jgi:glycine betaine/proline transport system substrate-binding protein
MPWPVAARKRISSAILVLIILCIIAGTWFIVSSSQKPVIRIYTAQWDTIRLNNAIAAYIIENGYGYPVRNVDATEYMVEGDLTSGKIDVIMELWRQNKVPYYHGQVQKGTLINLGPTFESGPQYFMIPRWMAEQYNISSIQDMKGHWELFRDPEDPSKGMVYTCLRGWECNAINEVKLEAYGLTRNYNIITPASDKALEQVYEQAMETHRPAFGYYWAPSVLGGSADWYILKEPPYTASCWNNVSNAAANRSLRPLNTACAYEDLPQDKGVSREMPEKAPDVVAMLEKMNVGYAPLNDMLIWKENNRISDPKQTAVHYLKTYENRWKEWVTPDAYAKIKQELDREPEG